MCTTRALSAGALLLLLAPLGADAGCVQKYLDGYCEEIGNKDMVARFAFNKWGCFAGSRRILKLQCAADDEAIQLEMCPEAEPIPFYFTDATQSSTLKRLRDQHADCAGLGLKGDRAPNGTNPFGLDPMLSAAFDGADKNDDGMLEYVEFVPISPIIRDFVTKTHAEHAAFAKYDLNRNDIISRDEFKKALVIAGVASDDENIDHLLAMYDTDPKDGRLNFVEFVPAWPLMSGRATQAFVEADTDSSGGITRSELAQAYRAAGVSLTNAELDAAFAAADEDGSGLLEFNEFIALADVLSGKMDASLDNFDTDKSGTLSKTELAAAYRTVGLSYDPATVDAAFAAADTDGSGEVDFVEYKPTYDLFNSVVKNAMAKYDVDQSGTLSKAEVGAALRAVGIMMTPAQLDAFFNSADADGNGQLDFDEFVPIADILAGKTSLLFRDADTDGDGILSMEELDAALKKVGVELTPEELAELFAKMDKDGSGGLNLAEFVPLESLVSGHIGRAFAVYDTTTDGGLDLLETASMLHACNMPYGHTPVESLMAASDKDGSDTLSILEFFQAWEEPAMKHAVSQAFEDVDRGAAETRTGTVSKFELKQALDYAGADSSEPTVEKLLTAADADGSRSIEHREYVPLLELIRGDRRVAFDALDTDKTCTMNRQELINALTAAELPHDKEYVDKHFAEADRDHSGDLSFNEYARTLADLINHAAAAAFKEADADGNGGLSLEEFAAAMRAAGYDFDDATMAEIFGSADKDGSGELSPEEFESVWDIVSGKMGSAFEGFDTDSNGGLNEQELANALRTRGLPYDEATVSVLLHAHDHDGSGEIELDEFVPLWDLLSGKVAKKFKEDDKNGDGELTRAELDAAFAEADLGYSPAAIANILAKNDVDRWGTISLGEYKPIYDVLTGRVLREFERYDVDDDDFLSSDELADALEDNGMNSDPKTVAEVMAAADKNGDGKLDQNEYLDVHAMFSNDTVKDRRYFRNFDANNNGYITKQEMADMIKSYQTIPIKKPFVDTWTDILLKVVIGMTISNIIILILACIADGTTKRLSAAAGGLSAGKSIGEVSGAWASSNALGRTNTGGSAGGSAPAPAKTVNRTDTGGSEVSDDDNIGAAPPPRGRTYLDEQVTRKSMSAAAPGAITTYDGKVDNSMTYILITAALADMTIMMLIRNTRHATLSRSQLTQSAFNTVALSLLLACKFNSHAVPREKPLTPDVIAYCALCAFICLPGFGLFKMIWHFAKALRETIAWHRNGRRNPKSTAHYNALAQPEETEEEKQAALKAAEEAAKKKQTSAAIVHRPPPAPGKPTKPASKWKGKKGAPAKAAAYDEQKTPAQIEAGATGAGGRNGAQSATKPSDYLVSHAVNWAVMVFIYIMLCFLILFFYYQKLGRTALNAALVCWAIMLICTFLILEPIFNLYIACVNPKYYDRRHDGGYTRYYSRKAYSGKAADRRQDSFKVHTVRDRVGPVAALE